MSNIFFSLAKAALCAVFLFTVAQPAFSQSKKPSGTKPAAVGPKVTQIDIEGLKALIKPKGKPLLINFWATWCDPCREEFPDLVKIDAQYKGKIDFVTVSLDDLADIKTYVPKFLTEVKAEMPAYLLKTADESAAITMVAKDWSGNLPLTILFAPSGETAYIRMGKIKMETVTAEINKALAPATSAGVDK
ncbi:MAG: TlpA family protein disulfide reductase [Pyrinomonadaceae bacterium]